MFKPIVDIIVDVETIGVFTPYRNEMILPNAVFNIGVVVAHKGKILLKENICIDEFWNYPIHRILDFYRKNFTESDFTLSYTTMKQFLMEWFYPLLREWSKDFRVRLWSYNAGFDRKAIEDTAALENCIVPKQIIKDWNCIMVLSNTLLAQQPELCKYSNFLVEEEYKCIGTDRAGQFISPKMNNRTKAETVYRYITQNPEFKEAHKGMDDATVELDILEWCKAHKGWSKINTSPIGGSWTIFNSLAKPFQRIGNNQQKQFADNLTVANVEKLQKIADSNKIELFF